MTETGNKFEELVGIVRKLRSENGCPWDREQSPLSLRRYILEETNELLEAIAAGDQQHVKEELGDILYLIVLQAQIYSEENNFTMDDVIAAISAKMVRRHPHVFSNGETGTADERRQKWLEIKAAEKAARLRPKKN